MDYISLEVQYNERERWERDVEDSIGKLSTIIIRVDPAEISKHDEELLEKIRRISANIRSLQEFRELGPNWHVDPIDIDAELEKMLEQERRKGKVA